MIVNSTDEALITKHPSPKFQKLSIKKKKKLSINIHGEKVCNIVQYAQRILI